MYVYIYIYIHRYNYTHLGRCRIGSPTQRRMIARTNNLIEQSIANLLSFGTQNCVRAIIWLFPISNRSIKKNCLGIARNGVAAETNAWENEAVQGGGAKEQEHGETEAVGSNNATDNIILTRVGLHRST